MMKIAIPTRGNSVDDHFGHCEVYTIITADDNLNIVHKESLPSPQGCGCKSNIAEVFQQIGVEVMLAGGIGGGAINVLNNHGIKVIRGCSGDINLLAEKYFKDGLTDSGISCSHHQHHDEGHTCTSTLK
jgi:predicted Fe-Mo cluster-binding NifX family protein